MIIHLVGGFLGSGKTTAIIHAAKILMAQGKKVGIVTNDQGKYLVDTAFFRLNQLPVTEVTGGCFCCNYHDLETLIDRMNEDISPDVLFAESVGSCTDLIATVIKPFLTLNNTKYIISSFSVFVDARLLRMKMAGSNLPFSESVTYIFDKQIEESNLLVVNKIDLIPPNALLEFKRQVEHTYYGKDIIFQNSLMSSDVQKWVTLFSSSEEAYPEQSMTVDYQLYGDGESKLAWLDGKFTITGENDALSKGMNQFIDQTVTSLSNQAVIGHLKMVIQDQQNAQKISITTADKTEWKLTWGGISGSKVDLLLNARVEFDHAQLKKLISDTLQRACSEHNLILTTNTLESFYPGLPNPRYRIK